MTAYEAFWWLLIPVTFIGALLAVAVVVEVIAPRSRAWIRRMQGIEAGKRALAQSQRMYGDTP